MKTSVKKSTKKVQFNSNPQFGLSKEQWTKLMKQGQKAGLSLIPMVRESLVAKFKLA